jgi:hypothetical protein
MRVIFEYEVEDAADAADAARTAYHWITDPAGTPPMAEVQADDGSSVVIDLEKELT